MVRPKAVIRWGPALLFALLLWLCVFASVRAFADPYTPPVLPGGTTEPTIEGSGGCPAGPAEPFEGEDVAAGEVRLLRTEVAAVCDVLQGRTDALLHRVWWLVAEAVAGAGQRGAAKAVLEEIRDRLDPPLSTRIVAVDGGSLPIEDAAGEQYNDQVVSAIDASGEASKGALYFIAGLVVAGLIGLLLAKAVDRGT